MEALREIFGLLFGEDGGLRQIIGVTLQMSSASTLISIAIGVPLGTLIGISEFKAKRMLMRICYTFMGLPPVVAGLLVYLTLSRSGPLGGLGLLHTVTAMICAQILIITPIAIGQTANIVNAQMPLMRDTMTGIRLPRQKQLAYTLYECRKPLVSVLCLGFGRAISEVGAAQIVGGNILNKTRVMTTAIVLETNMGRFDTAVALGVLLLVISFIVMSMAAFLQETKKG